MEQYMYASVIDQDGNYQNAVLLLETDVAMEDGTTSTQWVIQNYKLQEGESLVGATRPPCRTHAGDDGLVELRWNGTQWVEGATPEEIAQWELDNPMPEVVPSKTEQLRADIDFLALMGGVSL